MGAVFEATAAAFSASAYNPYAGSGTKPPNVVNDMINFMSAYNAWAYSTNFPASGNIYYNAASTAQNTMVADMINLANNLRTSTNAP
jgi:hypothetical protein